MKIALLGQLDANPVVRKKQQLRRLLGLAALPWLALGCGTGTPTQALRSPAPVMLGKSEGSGARPAATVGQPPVKPGAVVVQVKHQEEMPPPATVAPDCGAKTLPICLDTVLRLAEEQNPQLALGRERVYQAASDRQLAGKSWLPDFYAGVAWGRHEGGIQNEDGTLTQSSFGNLFGGLELSSSFDLREATYKVVSAEREVWQKRGDLTRTTHEQLLDSASAYIDLMTARTAEGFARDIYQKLEALYKDARNLADTEPPVAPLADSLNAALLGHEQAILKFKQQGDAASAKLAYLLGLDACTALVPVDDHLLTIDLVDASLPTDALVEKAVASGPGILEIEGLLATIQSAYDRAQGPSKWIPIFDMRMLEGGFGAGPGDNLAWANRFELGIAAKWNLTEYLTAKDRARSAISRIRQAQLTLEDLKGRLTLGVRESHSAILSGHGQIDRAYEAVQSAKEAYKKSKQRYDLKPQGTNAADLLQAVISPVNSYELAVGAWLQAVNEYDKAQVRLRLLVGPGTEQAACAEPGAEVQRSMIIGTRSK